MRTIKVLGLLLLCLLAVTHAQGPKIHYVSSLHNIISNPVFTSLKGGQMIYLKVSGHDLVASKNQIYVGTFPCVIPSDGVSDTFIAC